MTQNADTTRNKQAVGNNKEVIAYHNQIAAIIHIIAAIAICIIAGKTWLLLVI